MIQLPEHDRPRERLSRAGAGALGDHELLALVVGAGVPSRSALIVAQDLLAAGGGLPGLGRLGLDELRRVPGIGRARAARVVAALELGRRSVQRAAGDRPRFVSSAAVGRYLLPLHGGHREERFGVVLLDTRNRLIRSETLSVGTLDASLAHPREIFRAAAVGSAAAIVVFHNHPSGDPAPSRDDEVLTRRLVEAGELMGIAVLDHLILGEGRWFSFRDQGLL